MIELTKKNEAMKEAYVKVLMRKEQQHRERIELVHEEHRREWRQMANKNYLFEKVKELEMQIQSMKMEESHNMEIME